MDLDLNDDQALLHESFADFFTKEARPERVRAAEPLGFDDVLWEQIVALGATTMGVPGSLGGGGARALDLALVAQEVGKRVAPVPFVEAVTTANLLAHTGATDLVATCVEGALATIALRAPVDGVCRLVPAGAVADVSVVPIGDELVALRRSATGPRPYVPSPPNLGSSPIADVRLEDPSFERVVLASGVEARQLYDDALVEWKLLTAAALDGIRAAALDMVVDYVKARKAFGVPVGWFQAIQHRLADITVAGDGAHLLVYEAAWAREEGQANAPELASMAFLFLTELAFKTCRESLQFHGGYGYTLEYDIQLYFRRAKTWPLSLGDPRREYQNLAARLYPDGT
jgi:alkylation response protein AidB-like acyl-CoA dehydrogenase